MPKTRKGNGPFDLLQRRTLLLEKYSTWKAFDQTHENIAKLYETLVANSETGNQNLLYVCYVRWKLLNKKLCMLDIKNCYHLQISSTCFWRYVNSKNTSCQYSKTRSKGIV